jgi:hypothetical protein
MIRFGSMSCAILLGCAIADTAASVVSLCSVEFESKSTAPQKPVNGSPRDFLVSPSFHNNDSLLHFAGNFRKIAKLNVDKRSQVLLNVLPGEILRNRPQLCNSRKKPTTGKVLCGFAPDSVQNVAAAALNQMAAVLYKMLLFRMNDLRKNVSAKQS